MTPAQITHMSKQQVAILSVLMFFFMLVLAFMPGWKAVQGLEWGASVDFHRDAAFVRALLEGHYGEDPTYLGGSMWYTPFICWFEATVVWVTGSPVDQVLVQLGAWSNLLAPIAFFILVWYFFGPVRAVICSAVFLFFTIGHEPGWALPTYSPRLIPVSFCQWFFYLEVILIDRAFRTTRLGPSLAAGAGAGVTFLAHAAPAIISVLLIAIFTVSGSVSALRRNERGIAWSHVRAAIAAGASFVIASLPLTWILVGEYGMHVVNRSGFLYTYYALTLHEKEIFLFHNITLINAVALAGIWIVHKRLSGAASEKSEGARRMLFAWLSICIVLFGYSYVVSVLDTRFGIQLPGLVPSFHFYFYGKAALAVFAGLAFWQAIVWMLKRSRPASVQADPSLRRASVLSLFGLIAVASILNYPSYATRRDVFCVRNRNLAFAERTDGTDAARRIHELPWDAVILCDWELSIWPVLPTARKLVATAPTMGNPYMDQSERQADCELLLLGMREPRADSEALMAKYGVTHMLLRTGDFPLNPEASRWFPREVFRNKEYVLLAR